MVKSVNTPSWSTSICTDRQSPKKHTVTSLSPTQTLEEVLKTWVYRLQTWHYWVYWLMTLSTLDTRIYTRKRRTIEVVTPESHLFKEYTVYSEIFALKVLFLCIQRSGNDRIGVISESQSLLIQASNQIQVVFILTWGRELPSNCSSVIFSRIPTLCDYPGECLLC